MPGGLDGVPPGGSDIRTRGMLVVLSTRGDKIPDRVDEQASSFGGGCGNMPEPLSGNTGLARPSV